MNRLYVVESTYTVTGTMADHRLRLPAGQIGTFLVLVAQRLRLIIELRTEKSVALPNNLTLGEFPEIAHKWVMPLATDLDAGVSLVVVGQRQPAWVHALAHAINEI